MHFLGEEEIFAPIPPQLLPLSNIFSRPGFMCTVHIRIGTYIGHCPFNSTCYSHGNHQVPDSPTSLSVLTIHVVIITFYFIPSSSACEQFCFEYSSGRLHNNITVLAMYFIQNTHIRIDPFIMHKRIWSGLVPFDSDGMVAIFKFRITQGRTHETKWWPEAIAEVF